MLVLGSLITLLIGAVSASESTPSIDIGVAFESDHDLPVLKLPYGTWRAHQYDNETDVYKFRNIRYAAPPVGELRWSKPAPPDPIPGIHDGSYGNNCVCVPIPDGFFFPGSEDLVKNGAEDCLFLDVYVPGKVLKQRRSSVPVVFWIHGGAYVSGSKDQAIEMGIYDGTGLIQRADSDLIVVAINYRLGAFGFLAGEPLKSHGVFNAGLHDQRAALAWVQSYIHLLGGDRHNVSAWGQSAGAGSLVYHLTAEGGTLDPLFKRAIIQSPAFATYANPEGYSSLFRGFAEATGCTAEGEDVLRCLRSANSTTLKKANEMVYFGASPVPDGKYIRNTALVEYAKGNTWKNLDSVLVSHVLNEGSLFLPDPIPKGMLQDYISNNLPPNSTEQIKTMMNLYESRFANSTEKAMLTALYSELHVNCNMRGVLQAYPNIARAFQYSFIDDINGAHGSDVPATWYNPQLNNDTEPLWAQLQRYLTNHARTGDPNKPSSNEYKLKYWPRVSGLDNEMPNVFSLTNSRFETIQDGQMLKKVCETWTKALVGSA